MSESLGVAPGFWAAGHDHAWVAGSDDLAREHLLVVVAAQSLLLDEQAAQIQALSEQVKELTRMLGRNSGNSSLPPSTDRGRGPSRQRKGSNRQPGAPGFTLEIVADPDEVIDHLPGACGGCGADLADAADAGVVTRQVRDVPLAEVRIVEHRLHRKACRCGKVSTAAAPAGVDGPAVYAPNLRVVAVYLVGPACSGRAGPPS